jgi:hypothetical protein
LIPLVKYRGQTKPLPLPPSNWAAARSDVMR